jgi:hypothetical protein
MRFAGLLAGAMLFCCPLLAEAADAPVQVMIVGTFHMSNPGHDIHNAKVDDMLSPERQAQIAAAVNGIAAFKPTMVDAEWDADTARTRYASYLSGTLAPSRNEVVQLGFRLAKQSGLQTVEGVDVDGDFPFDAVQAYAGAHGSAALLAEQGAAVDAFIKTMTDTLNSEGVAATLRFLNDPARLASDNAFYRTTLKIGGGKEQPGAALLTAWYRRNFLICANIIQLTKPGDRVVVFYGSGHAFLLRQCIAETPGFQLVEPNTYLPK